MEGTPVDDPADFEALARRVRAHISEDVLLRSREFRRAAESQGPALGTFDLASAFERVSVWVDSLRRREVPDDAADFLRFAHLCRTVDLCAGLRGGDEFLQRLRAALRSGQFGQFEDALFEGEVATYWLSQMRAASVEFGDPSGHPDLRARMVSPNIAVTVALECKRVQPVSTATRRLSVKVDALEKQFARISDAHGGLKCIVWLHTDPSEQLVNRLVAAVEQLASSLQPSSSGWLTGGDMNGAFQVSLARLGAAAVRQDSEHVISDVPSHPVLVVRSEEVVGSGHRVKSLLSVRSDKLPHRTGNLRENVLKAIDQLAHFSPGEIGMIAIRLRPPQAMGDLWETDRTVRGALAQRSAQHVALVAVFWDEQTTQVEELENGTERIAARSLRPYFIANSECRLRFDSIDSFASTFVTPPESFIRDPVTGDIRPISATELEVLEQGGDHSAEFEKALAGVGGLPEEAGATTLYFRLLDRLALQLKSGLIGSIRAGARQFRIMLEADGHLRAVEVRLRQLASVATLDLRAWYDANELCIVLNWDKEGFSLSLWHPDESIRVIARSSRLRAVPIA